MVSFKFLASATLVAVVAASPFSFVKRQSSSVRCGSNTYSAADLAEATSKGCAFHWDGEQIGNNDYPHRFNNREGLPLSGNGPYQEFPILTSGAYTGGMLAGP